VVISSLRRRPESSWFISLDSCIRRNDGGAIDKSALVGSGTERELFPGGLDKLGTDPDLPACGYFVIPAQAGIQLVYFPGFLYSQE